MATSVAEIYDNDEHFAYIIYCDGSGSGADLQASIDLSSTVAGSGSASEICVELVQHSLKATDKFVQIKFHTQLVLQLYGVGQMGGEGISRITQLKTVDTTSSQDINFVFESAGTVFIQLRKVSGF